MLVAKGQARQMEAPLWTSQLELKNGCNIRVRPSPSEPCETAEGKGANDARDGRNATSPLPNLLGDS